MAHEDVHHAQNYPRDLKITRAQDPMQHELAVTQGRMTAQEKMDPPAVLRLRSG